MAGRGPAPKAHRQRARDERRRQSDQIVVRPDDIVRGPELPTDHELVPATVAFYETIRSAPQAQAYELTDWLIVTDVLLPLHSAFTSNPRKSAATAAEIRQIMASLGATVTDRLRAKITIDRGEPDPQASSDAVRKQADLAERMRAA